MGELYLIGVSSLNIEGGGHQIIVDARDGTVKVFDPAKGREGSQYYIAPGEVPSSPLEVPFPKQFWVDFRVLDCPALY